MIAKRAERVTYRDSGVDIDAGDEVVDRITRWVRRTYSPQVLAESHGFYGGFFRLLPGAGARTARGWKQPVLVGATDGVGTKLKIAFLTGRYDTVGIDLVAMSVNDVVVSGAAPLFFLDYIGTGVVRPADLEQVVRGIAVGCMQSGCALLGGETAELPGFYRKGEFDLAGFAVGIVEEKEILDGRRVRPGDRIIGIPSSGLHSNGFSLVRRVLLARGAKRALARRHADLGRTLGEELLEPTRIYVKPLLALLAKLRGGAQSRAGLAVRAFAHITGGGLLENIPRVLPRGCAALLERSSWPVPPIFSIVQRAGNIERREMDRVFNNGIGMVVIAAAGKEQRVLDELRRLRCPGHLVGEVVRGRRDVRIV